MFHFQGSVGDGLELCVAVGIHDAPPHEQFVQIVGYQISEIEGRHRIDYSRLNAIY